jgi:hypothetical protein
MRKTLAVALATMALMFGQVAFAQTGGNGNLTYTPLEPLPGENTVITGNGSAGLASYVSAAFKVLFVLGGLSAVVLIILGGMSYMASEISPSAKARAKERIQAAILGLLLLVGSWLILHTINPQLVDFKTFFAPCPSGATCGSVLDPNLNGDTGILNGGGGNGSGPGSSQDLQCQSNGSLCSLVPSIDPTNPWACSCG